MVIRCAGDFSLGLRPRVIPGEYFNVSPLFGGGSNLRLTSPPNFTEVPLLPPSPRLHFRVRVRSFPQANVFDLPRNSIPVARTYRPCSGPCGRAPPFRTSVASPSFPPNRSNGRYSFARFACVPVQSSLFFLLARSPPRFISFSRQNRPAELKRFINFLLFLPLSISSSHSQRIPLPIAKSPFPPPFFRSR